MAVRQEGDKHKLLNSCLLLQELQQAKHVFMFYSPVLSAFSSTTKWNKVWSAVFFMGVCLCVCVSCVMISAPSAAVSAQNVACITDWPLFIQKAAFINHD